jgi:lysophospholipase L1-like esterase
VTRHGGVARLTAPGALCVVLAACGGGAPSDPPRTATPEKREGAAASPLRIVALGDSETSGEGDSTGLGWVGRYARLLQSELGLRVRVSSSRGTG